jgi:DnaK suppressor protein
MKSKDLSKFEATLQAERDRVAAGQSANDESLHIDENEQADDVDAAASGAEQSFRMRLRSRDTLYLRKLDEALLRIKNGDFGICEECEEEIDLRRLNARPVSTLCISCKEEQERNENKSADGIQHKSIGRTFREQ